MLGERLISLIRSLDSASRELAEHAEAIDRFRQWNERDEDSLDVAVALARRVACGRSSRAARLRDSGGVVRCECPRVSTPAPAGPVGLAERHGVAP